MDLGMRDKVAIVTGSSRGLGLASAKALAAEGCRVTLSARTEATLHAAAREVSSVAGGDDRVLAVPADLASVEGVQTVIDRTVDRFGGLDVLVNNVGLGRGGGLLETSDAEWHSLRVRSGASSVDQCCRIHHRWQGQRRDRAPWTPP